MKTLILTAAMALMSVGSFAGNPVNNDGDKYCAKMKDGKMVIVHKGNPLTSEATLNNGAIVKPDGTVMMKDGTTVMLSDGECIHHDGTTETKRKK